MLQPVDAIAEFRTAWDANDLDRLADTLAPDAEFVSPLVARGVVRGKHDLRLLFAELHVGLSEVRWTEQIVDGDRGVLIAKARVGPFRVDNAMVFKLDRDGRIQRLRPHLRPYLAATWFGLTMSRRLVRHPGLLWRAGRRP
jgi:hypothetical protein